MVKGELVKEGRKVDNDLAPIRYMGPHDWPSEKHNRETKEEE